MPLTDLLRRRDIAAVLKHLRSQGLSRNALARLTGLTETRVRAISNGTQQITTYDVLERITEGLGVPRHVMGLGYDGPGPSSATPLTISRWFTLDGACLTSEPGRYLHSTKTLVTMAPLDRRQDGRGVLRLPSITGRISLAVDEETQQVYARDVSQIRMSSIHQTREITVPDAFILDDFTLGMLWAAIAMDEGLLDDDRLLAAESIPAASTEIMSPTVGLTGQLSPASSMWLGSTVCAAHIMRKLPDLSDTPVFWTREQRGEEASNWLLFGHKYHYLQRLAAMLPPEGTSRTFCVPPSAVIASPQPERVMFLLAIALMESFKVKVQISTEPSHSGIDGFVLDRRRAIVANWVGNDGTWTADLTDSWPTVSSYVQAVGDATARSILTGSEPLRRMRQAADYLGLDWRWIIGRSMSISDHGFSGIYTPRSRLLSIEGIDRACAYLASLASSQR